MIMSLKNSNDTIGNRTRDLPVCSVVYIYIITYARKFGTCLYLCLQEGLVDLYTAKDYFIILLLVATVGITPGPAEP